MGSHEMSPLTLLFMLFHQMLVPMMVMIFAGFVVLRWLVYFTVIRHDWFTREFEKRIQKYISDNQHKTGLSFYVAIKRNMEKTFYELFKVRAVMKRRRPDLVMDPMDRIFLVKQGAAWLVQETLRQIRYLKGSQELKSHEIAKAVFQNNPSYSKLFGVIPLGGLNDILNVLPGLFVVGGIFGTFLGIREALPNLSNLDFTNPDKTKEAIDTFLVHVGFAMQASIFGILFSVSSNILNTAWSADRIFVTVIDRLENTLDNVWRICDNNLLPVKNSNFEESKDPMDALAEDYLNQEWELAQPRGLDAPNQRKSA